MKSEVEVMKRKSEMDAMNNIVPQDRQAKQSQPKQPRKKVSRPISQVAYELDMAKKQRSALQKKITWLEAELKQIQAESRAKRKNPKNGAVISYNINDMPTTE